jgi:hypothetical protein
MEADYLVAGSGASAMAFVDEMLTRTDATFVMFDRRPAPGGHWNDTYPYVRLHQPALTYGVASRPLGSHRIDAEGTNRGLLELSSGTEVTNYFHALMRDRFLPSGRVRYFPLCERSGEHSFRELFSGKEHSVDIRRKLVDATYLTTSIPLTHERRFEVGPGVACEPPNALPRLATRFRHVTVLGAGKTGIDAVVWLLSNGWPSDAITWVMPRDGWYWVREGLQPGMAFFDTTMENMIRQNEAYAAATSIDDLGLRMEAAGSWARLSPDVTPGLYHAATVSRGELETLRHVRDVVRLGRVQRIDAARMQFAEGEVVVRPETLFVDCTASIFELNEPDDTPVFSDDRIALKMIRLYQPCFGAALSAYMEATIGDTGRIQAMTQTTPMTDTVADFTRSMSTSMENESAWSSEPDIAAWMAGCRLNPAHYTIADFDPSDEVRVATMGRMQATGIPAYENLKRLAATAKQDCRTGVSA